MSEIHQTPMITAPKKIQGRRKPWTQRHQQKRTADLITREPQGAAELETAAGSEAQITFNMPPQASEITQRRASVQILTPPTISVEWSSTQSCPSPEVGNVQVTAGPEPATPENTKAASQHNNPTQETVKTTSQTTPRTTFDRDPTVPSRTATTSVSTVSSTSQHQIFTTLADHHFFVPPNASLNTSSLILFKHNTPSLERFRLLHNQLFIELGRVVEEQLQPSLNPETNAEAYSQREEIMLGLLIDVVPALNHLTETIGKEVKSGIQKHRAGLRLWVGEKERSPK